jgi:hypothetical protein
MSVMLMLRYRCALNLRHPQLGEDQKAKYCPDHWTAGPKLHMSEIYQKGSA